MSRVKNNCYECKNRKTLAGSCHSGCSKPDLFMTGDSWGISNGWFSYPYNFDPIWMTKKCDNFSLKGDKQNVK